MLKAIQSAMPLKTVVLASDGKGLPSDLIEAKSGIDGLAMMDDELTPY